MDISSPRRERSISRQYKFDEACSLVDVQPYVVRFWQTEFAVLAPLAGQSRDEFTAGDLDIIRRIKELLYDEGYSIASAKRKIDAELEEGGLRGRSVLELDDPIRDEAENDEVAAQDLTVSDLPDLGSLTRRVERLEGGVAALVAEARQLAAELKPKPGD